MHFIHSTIIYSTLNLSCDKIDVLSNKDETFVSELQVFFLLLLVLYILHNVVIKIITRLLLCLVLGSFFSSFF